MTDFIRSKVADAGLCGSLRAATRSRGLSLRDRCCLGLGLKTGLPVRTTEIRWRDIEIDVMVRVIR
jgi:PIN domain nuclease of toxin-antitoxin system